LSTCQLANLPTLKMIYFFYGQDTYSNKKAVKKIIADFIEKEGSDLNVNYLFGESLSKERFVTAVTAAPFLGENRLVVLNNLLLSADKEIKESVVSYLPKIPGFTTLLISEGGDPDKRESEFKALSKLKDTINYAAPDEIKLRQFVSEITTKGDMKISSQATYLLLQAVGADYWRLGNELNKLLDLAASEGKKEISPEMVSQNIHANNNLKIFDLTDALAEKNIKKAIKTLAIFRKYGEDDAKIFNMIVSHMRSLFLVSSLSGKSPDEINQATKVHPFVIKKMISSLRKIDRKKLVDFYLNLSDNDWQIKSGKLTYGSAIDLMLIKFCEN